MSYLEITIESADDLINLINTHDIVYCKSDRYIDNKLIEESFSRDSRYSFLSYYEKKYVSFHSIYEQNELHYDGISSDNKRVIPDYLFFNVEAAHSADGGEFLLLHTTDFLDSLPNKIVNRLENLTICYYQFKSFFNPKPHKDQFSFAVKAVDNYCGNRVLRMHIPLTVYKNDVLCDGQFVHCLVDDIKISAPGYSGKDLLEFYEELNSYIFQSKALYKFKLKKNDILIVDNRSVFHGRLATTIQDKRLMHRFQLVKRPPI